MRRREFIAWTFGAAVGWPLNVLAQQGEPIRRIGVLFGVSLNDRAVEARYAAFRQGLQQLGWTEGRNLRIDIRSSSGNSADARKLAGELVALAPDVILAIGSLSLGEMLQVTSTVPIVFALIIDPVGAGFVDSLSQPGGNATGFMQFEYSLCGKWLQLLKEIAPGVTRAAVLRDASVTAGTSQFAVVQSVAPSVEVEVSPVNERDAPAIEHSIASFARAANGGLIVTTGALSVVHRDLIVTLAARHKLPTVYSDRSFVEAGGLISYGPNYVDETRRAAGYVDRILKGEKPADLPVQAPTKYELVINLKTAKELGFVMPQVVLARADEVIE
jgi:putative ABC transport system substrate-binding protein